MQTIPFESIYTLDFSLNVTNTLKQFWDKYTLFNCIGKPKEKNILLFLSGCKAEYTLPTGKKLYAVSGDAVYAPINFQYSVRFYDFSEGAHTIGINFFLFDSSGIPFVPDGGIQIFSCQGSRIPMLFSKAEQAGSSSVVSPGKLKGIVYEILVLLSEMTRRKTLAETNFHVIAKGIDYLENDTAQTLSISEIAALCNVSAVYFRRLFKAYSGLPPAEYRIANKIEKAKLLLQHEDLSVQKISELLGFSSAAYFAKQFRLICGETPSQFRKK